MPLWKQMLQDFLVKLWSRKKKMKRCNCERIFYKEWQNAASKFLKKKPPPQSAHKQSIALHLPHKEKTGAESGSKTNHYTASKFQPSQSTYLSPKRASVCHAHSVSKGW